MSLLADVLVGAVGGTGQGLVKSAEFDFAKEREALETERLKDLQRVRQAGADRRQAVSDANAMNRVQQQGRDRAALQKQSDAAFMERLKLQLKNNLDVAAAKDGGEKAKQIGIYYEEYTKVDQEITKLLEAESKMDAKLGQLNPTADAAMRQKFKDQIDVLRARKTSLMDALRDLEGDLPSGTTAKKRADTLAEAEAADKQAKIDAVKALTSESEDVVEMAQRLNAVGEKNLTAGEKQWLKLVEDENDEIYQMLIKGTILEQIEKKEKDTTPSVGYGDLRDRRDPSKIQLLNLFNMGDVPSDETIRRARQSQGLLD